MKPIYKSLALASMTLQVSLALNAEMRDDESASTIALQAELLDSLRVELVAQNVSGARNLIESGECVVNGSNLVIALDTDEWTRGAMYRVQVLATFGTQTQVIYALNVTVPYYIALSDVPQEFEDNVTIVSTITDVTEADLEGLALEETSQEIKAAITPISATAEAYNVGKTQLAAAITSKGVETSPTETYPEMAEKVNAISQETYEINGGEMYAKQLFGNLETPNYWNLYDVLAQLLSDGRLVNYGGILLAEYYRGYDSLVLSGAGSGGAYVVSDKDGNGQFKMYTEDITHVWDTNWDGKTTRWVAYCFASEGHSFGITNTNTSPRNIFIGRNVGEIRNFTDGRIGSIVVPDGNTLGEFKPGTYSNNYDRRFVLRNLSAISTPIISGNKLFNNVVDFYVHASQITNYVIDTNSINQNVLGTITIVCDTAMTHPLVINQITADTVILKIPSIAEGTNNINISGVFAKNIVLLDLEGNSNRLGYFCRNMKYIYVGYKENDKSRTVHLTFQDSVISNLTDIELQDGYCKPIVFPTDAPLTESNMYAHILQRLKQDEPDCGDGVTITLGSTNLAKLTSAESVQLLDDLTNIYGYTFA